MASSHIGADWQPGQISYTETWSVQGLNPTKEPLQGKRLPTPTPRRQMELAWKAEGRNVSQQLCLPRERSNAHRGGEEREERRGEERWGEEREERRGEEREERKGEDYSTTSSYTDLGTAAELQDCPFLVVSLISLLPLNCAGRHPHMCFGSLMNEWWKRKLSSEKSSRGARSLLVDWVL